jgi:hypothetical protein
MPICIVPISAGEISRNRSAGTYVFVPGQGPASGLVHRMRRRGRLGAAGTWTAILSTSPTKEVALRQYLTGCWCSSAMMTHALTSVGHAADLPWRALGPFSIPRIRSQNSEYSPAKTGNLPGRKVAHSHAVPAGGQAGPRRRQRNASGRMRGVFQVYTGILADRELSG